jgi:hypothetical protein
MIATVHRYRSELPGRRVELYREICEVFLGKRQDVRDVERPIDLAPAQKQCVLEPLAFHMMSKRLREITVAEAETVVAPVLNRVSPTTSATDFLKMVEDTSGLLLEKESGEYAFAHKTFQEYLTAVHCRDQRLENELTRVVADDWWHETVRLYVAQSDASNILEACLRGDPPIPAAIVLAVECIEEAQQFDQKWRDVLERILTSDADDEAQQRIYSEALLRLRLRKMLPLGESSWADTKLVRLAEYQVFLDTQREKGLFYQPDHWKQYRYARGQGGLPVAGLRASDATAFCAWLSNRFEIWQYRFQRSKSSVPPHLHLSIPTKC